MPELNGSTEINAIGIPINANEKNHINAALKAIAAKQSRVQRYMNYYNGFHPFNFASEKFTTEFGTRLQKFCDNLCKIPVKAPADRLEVIGFSSEAKSNVYNESWEIWKYSNMPRIAKRVHRDAFKTSDGYVLVWPDADDNVRIMHQDARTCHAVYNSETQKIERAAKLWIGNDGFVYLTLYYPDRVEKYITRKTQTEGSIPATAAAFIRRSVAGEEWPIENPTGVCPIFHFGLEHSILDDVIPLNDALNKALADLLVSSEANSLRQRWSTGISYETDPESGKQIIPWSNDAKYVGSSTTEAKFGEFGDAALEAFLKVANDFRAEIATVSGVPSYYFRLESGNLPSGETLRKAETRFTNLIKDAQLDFGEVWANVMRLAMKMEDKNFDEKAIETTWSPADPMSDTEKVELAGKKKAIGVSDRQNLSEVGYTDQQITKMEGENKKQADAAAKGFAKVFDAGSSIAGGQ